MPNNIAIGWEELLTDAEKLDPSLLGTGNTVVAPDNPVLIMRDENDSISGFMYGDMDRLMIGDPVNLWTEELIRDPVSKKVVGTHVTRTNGTIVDELFQYDENGKFTGTKLVYGGDGTHPDFPEPDPIEPDPAPIP